MSIEDIVRERPDKRATELSTVRVASLGEVSDEINCLPEGRSEYVSQAGAFAVVPPDAFKEINFRFGMERSRKRHGG